MIIEDTISIIDNHFMRKSNTERTVFGKCHLVFLLQPKYNKKIQEIILLIIFLFTVKFSDRFFFKKKKNIFKQRILKLLCCRPVQLKATRRERLVNSYSCSKRVHQPWGLPPPCVPLL